MGQSFSFPHKAERKPARIRAQNPAAASSFIRRSSMAGRGQSYGVILYEPPPSPPSSRRNKPTSTTPPCRPPSPGVNDMAATLKRSRGKRSSQGEIDAGSHRSAPAAHTLAASPRQSLSSSLTFRGSIVPTSSRTNTRTRTSRNDRRCAGASAAPTSAPFSSSSAKPRLPSLRVGELEQIFVAIVKGGDATTRRKLPLQA